MSEHERDPLPPSGRYWEGRLVRLRAMQPDDWPPHFHDEHADPEGVRCLHTGMPLPTSPDASRCFFERFAEFANAAERIAFSIEALDGTLVGGINLHSRNERHGTFETGSRIYTRYRGRGYAFDAKLLLLRYAFHELRLQKYVIRCIASNEPMQRHAQRLGCQLEGRLRRQFFTAGEYRDELIYGLLREEFDALWERERAGDDPGTHPGEPLR